MQFYIRRMAEVDAGAVARIVAAGYRLLAAREGFSDEQLHRLHTERCTEAVVREGWLPQWDCFVAEGERQALGAMTVDGCDLGELWVDPEHHREGIGRALFEEAERRIRAAGHTTMTLRCSALSSRPFYEAMGMRAVGSTPCPFGPLEGWPLTQYRKELCVGA